MINKVEIINYLGETLTMELSYPERSGFSIFNITGIGPERAEIRVSDIVTADGGIYNSARLPSRNIVMSIRFFEWNGKTVEDIRNESYRYFPIKKFIKMIIHTQNRIAEIDGYVEANEPVIFSKETHTQISIICPFPFFHASGIDGLNVTKFYGARPRFRFPFPKLNVRAPRMIMAENVIRSEEIVRYDGDAEIGMTIIIDAIGPVGDLIIWNVLTRKKMVLSANRLQILTGNSLNSGDRIIISTVKGNKFVHLLREGITTNILNVLDRNPEWFQLSKGDNIFSFESDFGNENLLFSIENQTLYEGV